MVSDFVDVDRAFGDLYGNYSPLIFVLEKVTFSVMGNPLFVSYIANPRARQPTANKVSTSRFARATTRAVHSFHQPLAGYQHTPLMDLAHLAGKLGIANLWIKDESQRFDLNAFKVLGASYAAAKIVSRLLGLSGDELSLEVPDARAVRYQLQDLTFITATDGNHGRAVAWTAERLGCNAVVYMPRSSSPARFDAIASHGASVSIVDGDYDDAVRQAAAESRAHGWTLIQDTAWEGYEEIPFWIMEGYLTIVHEAMSQLKGKLPTHVLVQCGVGSLAGAVQGQMCELFGDRRPVLAVLEPLEAACCYQSMAAGAEDPTKAEGSYETIMAGLACGEPSTIAWPILRDYADVFVICADGVSENGMQILARPHGDDPRVVSGESGAVTAGLLATILVHDVPAKHSDLSAALAGLLATVLGHDASATYSDLKAVLGLDRNSRVLLISTEGATDPESYNRIIRSV
jgi:diaminopropionate ammonia-lyase